MALAAWEPDLEGESRGGGTGRVRCLVDLDAPCNLACPYCPRRTRGAPMDASSALALADALADQVVASGVGAATAVFYGGEPLLERERLFEQARHLTIALGRAKVECELGLITNGTLLDPATAARLAQLGFTRASVTVGGTEQVHEMRRRSVGGTASYRAILHNVSQARHHLDVTVRYELHSGMDAVRLPLLIADLEQFGVLGGERTVKVVVQSARSYAQQARALFGAPRPGLYRHRESRDLDG